MKLNIGGVEFRKPGWHPPGSRCNCDGHYFPLMGNPRVAALRAFYRREPIPDGLVPCTSNPIRDVKHEDVNWETAGSPVTACAKCNRTMVDDVSEWPAWSKVAPVNSTTPGICGWCATKEAR